MKDIYSTTSRVPLARHSEIVEKLANAPVIDCRNLYSLAGHAVTEYFAQQDIENSRTKVRTRKLVTDLSRAVRSCVDYVNDEIDGNEDGSDGIEKDFEAIVLNTYENISDGGDRAFDVAVQDILHTIPEITVHDNSNDAWKQQIYLFRVATAHAGHDLVTELIRTDRSSPTRLDSGMPNVIYDLNFAAYEL